jgi:hypothetical protein
MDEAAACVKIQAVMRGYQARHKVGNDVLGRPVTKVQALYRQVPHIEGELLWECIAVSPGLACCFRLEHRALTCQVRNLNCRVWCVQGAPR